MGKTMKEAIRDTSKNKALGPDRKAPINLNYLGPLAFRYLTFKLNHKSFCKQCKYPEHVEKWPNYKPTEAGKTHRQI